MLPLLSVAVPLTSCCAPDASWDAPLVSVPLFAESWDAPLVSVLPLVSSCVAPFLIVLLFFVSFVAPESIDLIAFVISPLYAFLSDCNPVLSSDTLDARVSRFSQSSPR